MNNGATAKLIIAATKSSVAGTILNEAQLLIFHLNCLKQIKKLIPYERICRNIHVYYFCCPVGRPLGGRRSLIGGLFCCSHLTDPEN